MKYEPKFTQPLICQLMESEERGGMTLRDYFAAKAMQALITRIAMSGGDQARKAYEIADAMLKARKQ